MDRDHSLLGLRLVMKAHPGASVRVRDLGEISSWVCADVGWDERQGLVGRPEVRYAIWKRSGNVHRVMEAGEAYPEAVTDDPVFEVPPGWRTDAAMTYDNGGLWSITQERVRQIEEEEYDADHDDKHQRGELARAAACYAAPFIATQVLGYSPFLHHIDAWPFGTRSDKRLDRPGHEQGSRDAEVTGETHEALDRDRFRRLVAPDDLTEHAGRIRELAKAGALIAAEIDRIQRLAVEQGLEYDAALQD